ncbi:MAG: hypothetical protein AB1758_24680, partial [Candidatus Eremiobacterota bacterium]
MRSMTLPDKKRIALAALADLRALVMLLVSRSSMAGLMAGAAIGYVGYRISDQTPDTLLPMLLLGCLWGLVGGVIYEIFLKDLRLAAPVALVLFGSPSPKRDFAEAFESEPPGEMHEPVHAA